MTHPDITETPTTRSMNHDPSSPVPARDRHPLTMSEQDEAILESTRKKGFQAKTHSLQVAGAQLTLGELFFVLNLCAVAFWVYFFVSPILACVAGCTILFIAIMRLLGHRPAFIGGTIGFCLAGALAIGSGLLFQLSTANMAALAPAAGTFGYCIGAIITELAE